MAWPTGPTYALHTAAYYLRLREEPPRQDPYNGLQRLAYTGTLVLAVLAVLSGLVLYKPVQLHWLKVLFGGYAPARAVHLGVLVLLALFTVGHVVVEFRSFDAGYFSSWDGPSAFHPQTILAYGMNGQPLPPEYGAPLRLYSGVKLGYKLVKYLTEVNFLPEPTGGYWEDRGYEWFAGV